MRKEEEKKKEQEIAQVGHEQLESVCKPAVPSIGQKTNALRKAVGCISVKKCFLK